MAARRLGVTKSKISNNLSKLEVTLGTQLLLRGPHGSILTADGRALLEELRKPMTQLVETWSRFNHHRLGIKKTFRITLPDDLAELVFENLLTTIRKTHPNVALEIHGSNDIVDFQNHNIDLAVRFGQNASPELRRKKIGTAALGHFASPACLKNYQQNMGAMPFASYKNLKFRKGLGDNSNGSQDETIFNSMVLLKKYTLRGLGSAILPEFYVRTELSQRSLIRLPKTTPLKIPLYLLSRPSHSEHKDFKFLKHKLELLLRECINETTT